MAHLLELDLPELQLAVDVLHLLGFPGVLLLQQRDPLQRLAALLLRGLQLRLRRSQLPVQLLPLLLDGGDLLEQLLALLVDLG